MQRDIGPFDCAGEILKNIKSGILLNSRLGEKINTMTIGWGCMGVEWGKPVFIAFVRQHRFTATCLESCAEFTVSAPGGVTDRRISGFAGTRSGRNVDKIAALNLHLEEPKAISVPGIAEFPLTLECRIIYKQLQDIQCLPANVRESLYPQNVPCEHTGANRDAHIAYCGEIVASYIIAQE